jgi:hypothetical protein
MRVSVEEEKRKYVELFNEKELILGAIEGLAFLTLNYLTSASIENEERLLKSIESFHSKYRNNPENSVNLKKVR